MNGSNKRVSAGWSLFGATVLTSLAIVVIAASHPAAVSATVRDAAARAVEASAVRYCVADPGEARTVRGHSELQLLLD